MTTFVIALLGALAANALCCAAFVAWIGVQQRRVAKLEQEQLAKLEAEMERSALEVLKGNRRVQRSCQCGYCAMVRAYEDGRMQAACAGGGHN